MANLENLIRRIRLGEDSSLELKSIRTSGGKVVGPSRDDFSDELAAFANAGGGQLILGVNDDTRDISGIPLAKLDIVQGWVSEICNDSIKPPLHNVSINKIELPDHSGTLQPVIYMDVERSLYVHKSAGGYFQRRGDSKREMTPEYLARLLQERSQTRVIRFDESPVPEARWENMDRDLSTRFLHPAVDLMEGSPRTTESDQADPVEQHTDTFNDDTARKARLLVDDGNDRARLTLAGVLMCTREPHRWLPQAVIQAVCYVGERTDENYQRDARDIVGPLDVQVWGAMHFVRKNTRVSATKTTAREEYPEYSERALFEALVNAVAHRDYAIHGSRIRLHLFPDRLELYVPGSLPNTLTPETMHTRQYNRNERIVSLLAQCPVDTSVVGHRQRLMDRRGEGVTIILRESQQLSRRMPAYEVFDDSELRLTIWSAARQGNS